MSNAYSAYNKQQANNESLRVTEGRALLRCAARMEAVQDPSVDYFTYCEAVRQNQKLWTIFQASVFEETSNLPKDLVDLLRSLSIYVDRRSIRAYVEHDAQILNVLIGINKQIAAGLMQAPEAAQPVETSVQTPAPSLSIDPINISG